MAIITETSDDGDPTKYQQEEKKQNEKPKEVGQEDEVVENRPRVHLPEELIESIIAIIRRCKYPRLSIVSKGFGHIISSAELFATRSRLGLTEPVLYTLICISPLDDINASCLWFILHRSNISLRLGRVSSLPRMLQRSTAVTIGHKIYVMGGFNNLPVKTVMLIDCRFHRLEYLQSMQRARIHAAAGVIDGKIYVVGGRKRNYHDWVEVYDVQNGNWQTVPGPCPDVGCPTGNFVVHVVLDDKIYIMSGEYCLAYDPRRRSWETWGPESQQSLFWHTSSCVVDDLLYAIYPESVLGSPILVYNPRDMVWRPVKGVDVLPGLVYYESRMANFCGKLVILGYYPSCKQNVWCVEVALEKREDGDIWGKVESISLVHSFDSSPYLLLSRTVTV